MQSKSTIVIAALLACVSSEVIYNAEGFIKCSPALVVAPTSIAAVQNQVLAAIKNKQMYFRLTFSVRGFGAGHSTNHILCADEGVNIVTLNLNEITNVDAAKMQVTVGGGAPLAKFLNDMVAYNMVVPGLVDYGAITVAGSIATGAHSSSLKHKTAVHDYMIAGISLLTQATIVNGLGQVINITDKDPDFPAVRANLGALGILTHVTFQALPLYKVKGTQFDLSKDIATLPSRIINIVKQHDFANLYYFSENDAAILHTYNIVDKDTPGNGVRTTWDPSFSSVVPWGYYKVIGLLNGLSSNEMCWLAGTRVSQLKGPETTQEGKPEC
jgi:FAD/FMN-containing dehydrogenase